VDDFSRWDAIFTPHQTDTRLLVGAFQPEDDLIISEHITLIVLRLVSLRRLGTRYWFKRQASRFNFKIWRWSVSRSRRLDALVQFGAGLGRPGDKDDKDSKEAEPKTKKKKRQALRLRMITTPHPGSRRSRLFIVRGQLRTDEHLGVTSKELSPPKTSREGRVRVAFIKAVH